jgi:hypothetical protein
MVCKSLNYGYRVFEFCPQNGSLRRSPRGSVNYGLDDRRSVSAFHSALASTHGGEVDQIRPFGEVSDEPEQPQYHEEEDEQDHALPRSSLGLRAIDAIKLHGRVPHPFQTVHEGAHRWFPSSCAGLCPWGRWAAGSQAGRTWPQMRQR